MTRIQYIDDVQGNFQEAHGSDGRLNVSSRSDERIYYNSRDKGQSYSLAFCDAAASAGDYNVVLYNTNPKADAKTLVIHSIGVNSSAAGSFKLHKVTGTAATGAVSATPYNLGGHSNTATVTASTVVNSDSSPISGITSSAVIDHAGVAAGGHEEMRIQDSIRLGEDEGIAIELDTGGGTAYGVIFFYFE